VSAQPPRFLGSHGEDWCVRPAQLGPPDHITAHVMHWLIVPGPPLSCYLAMVPPTVDPNEATFYHAHPETWSIHVMLSGSGKHFVDDRCHEIGPGTVIYQGPGVRHSIYPNPGQHIMHLSIQYPSAGHAKEEWRVCPEAGTTDHFGEAAAFLERFGAPEDLIARLKREEIFVGERWAEFVKRAGK
jgi:mannose-6-phosphate isomerase-like protein (cupin superfamily)